MLKYNPINCPTDRLEDSNKLRNSLEKCFKYTQDITVNVIFDFISPTDTLGRIDYLLFIEIPNFEGNYYRNAQKVYLNSLCLAIRKFEENEIIGVDDEVILTDVGSWEYRKHMVEERQQITNFVLDSFPDVKFFDVSLVYLIDAPKLMQRIVKCNIYVNLDFFDALKTIVNDALNNTRGNKENCDCLLGMAMNSFVSSFVDIAERHTRQGILTKKKMNELTKKNTSSLMNQAFQTVGNKLCVISGKAGSGKTLALMKILYNQIKNGDDSIHRNCRLLTFNNMLVADIKQTMKGLRGVTPTKLSVMTLHKFFYKIYKKSPVHVLHMDQSEFEKIIDLCRSRVLKFNCLFIAISDDSEYLNWSNIENYKQRFPDYIKDTEISEYLDYVKYLRKKGKKTKVSDLEIFQTYYIDEKKKLFLENYHKGAFLSGYDAILKELYLVFHNLDKFVDEYGFKMAYTVQELQQKEIFKARYQELYNAFITEANKKLEEEIINTDKLLDEYKKRLESLYNEISLVQESIDIEKQKVHIENSLKKIKKMVNWSKLILVDEAQDCKLYEKALILELNGSDDTVIATGGSDQLIRLPIETDWTNLFGHSIDHTKITLRSVSFRQKGNIINFLNVYASEFALGTTLAVPPETENYGRVIIDVRSLAPTKFPLDQIDTLYVGGQSAGCSNFENILVLLPRNKYVWRDSNKSVNVTIDANSTIKIHDSSKERHAILDMPDYLNALDGTLKDKRKFIETVGQDNTRCILYDSCRGLEAWNVMCMDLDSFFEEKFQSEDATLYAKEQAGLFENAVEIYQTRFASLWCYMAMTRAIDTLYIKLTNKNNLFSQKVISIAEKNNFIELIQ